METEKSACPTWTEAVPASEVSTSWPALPFSPSSQITRENTNVTALCPPAGDTSVKPSFLEAPPQKEDLKEHVCSPPAAFISDSQNCKIPSEVIHFSFQLVFACLFLCRWGEVRGPGSTHWAPPFLYLLLPKCVERVHKLFTHPASANTVIVTWKMRY